MRSAVQAGWGEASLAAAEINAPTADCKQTNEFSEAEGGMGRGRLGGGRAAADGAAEGRRLGPAYLCYEHAHRHSLAEE